MLLLLKFLKSKVFPIALALLIGLWLGFLAFVRYTPRAPVVHQDPYGATVVQVPAAVLDREVVQYVSDKEGVTALLKELQALRMKVTQLDETMAKHVSTGGGRVEPVDPSTLPPNQQPTGDGPVTRFHDWRLTFIQNGQDARYTLDQQFEVLQASGRDKSGKPFSHTQLFEVGPGDTKTRIPTVKETVVITDGTVPHWYAGASLQGGVVESFAGGKWQSGGFVGIQWLARGRTRAPNDTKWAIGTIGGYFGQTMEPAVLPFSVNVGAFAPLLSNLWVSPIIGYSIQKRSVARWGFSLTATF